MIVPISQAVAVGIHDQGRRVEWVDVQAVAAQFHVVDDTALQHVADVCAGPDSITGEQFVSDRPSANSFRAFQHGHAHTGPREIICGDQSVVACAYYDATI